MLLAFLSGILSFSHQSSYKSENKYCNLLYDFGAKSLNMTSSSDLIFKISVKNEIWSVDDISDPYNILLIGFPIWF